MSEAAHVRAWLVVEALCRVAGGGPGSRVGQISAQALALPWRREQPRISPQKRDDMKSCLRLPGSIRADRPYVSQAGRARVNANRGYFWLHKRVLMFLLKSRPGSSTCFSVS